MSNLHSKVLTYFHHVLADQFGLQLLQQSNANPEYSLPPFSYEHIENWRKQVVRQEASEYRHEPFGREIVGRHLDFTQVRKELRHVKLD